MFVVPLIRVTPVLVSVPETGTMMGPVISALVPSVKTLILFLIISAVISAQCGSQPLPL